MKNILILFLFIYFLFAQGNSTNIENMSMHEQPNINKTNDIKFTDGELKYLKEKKKISMCIDPNAMPYEMIKDGEHYGMVSDYFKNFQKHLSIPIEIVKTKDWVETLSFARAKKCDIISLALKTPNRLSYLNFTKPYIKSSMSLATKINHPFVTNLNQVKHFKIGVIKGYADYELLKNKYPDINLIKVNSLEEGLELVNQEKIYGFMSSLISMGHAIHKKYIDNLKITGNFQEDLGLSIAIRKDSPQLLTLFNKLIENIKEEEHQNILNNWLSVKFEKNFNTSFLIKIALFVLFGIILFTYWQFLLKKQNRILKESHEDSEKLINSTLEAIFVSVNGKIINVNDVGVKLFGFDKKEDVIGLEVFDLVHKNDRHLVLENLKINNGNPYEINTIKTDGTLFPVLIKGQNTTLFNKDVRISAIVDLSELKRKDNLIAQQSKMAAMGEMIGNIAHQWRQPLSVISVAASGVKFQKEMNILDDEHFLQSMEGIIKSSAYLSQTIDDFKNFISDNKKKNKFNLKIYVHKNLSILETMLKTNHIKLIIDIEDGIVLNNYENELTQVLINIITNSKDALIENQIGKKVIFIIAKSDQNSVLISIKDNAGGIEENIITKVFDPYFTTKHKSQGTGLGLYMTNRIIDESMNGNIEVKNTQYSYQDKICTGAEFIITFSY